MSGHNILHKDLLEAPYLMNDPGTGGTITVDRQFAVCPVDTTGGAAAETLAQPTKAGLFCTVILAADGGDLTLTVTGGYNATGDTSITLDNAGDFVVFFSVKVGSSCYWRVIGQEGSGVSTENATIASLTATAATITELTAPAATITALTAPAATITELKLGVQTIDMADAAVALTAATLTGNVLFVDPNSAGAAEDLKLPPEADCAGTVLIIVNTGGEHITVKDDAGTTTLVIIEDTETGIAVCNGTAWKAGHLTTAVA